jgi:spiro-SPASM protein
MPADAFSRFASAAAEFSGEAVISLSAWGEALSHPDIESIIAATLSHPGLSLLIETDGSVVTEEQTARIAEIVRSSPARTTGYDPIAWIVYTDAADETAYSRMHPGFPEFSGSEVPSYRQALRALEILTARFGGAVYPQFMRTTINEDQLETFFRAYKEKGNLIIQKYDPFCGRLPDMRPADIAPLAGNPCWHLARDMVILADGTVPLCKEYVLDGEGTVNVFTDGIAAAWERTGKTTMLCKDCDEYYTFNF